MQNYKKWVRKQNCAFVRKKRFWIHSRGNRSSSSSSSRSLSQMRERKGHIQMEETKSCREKRQSIAKDFFYYIGIIVRVQTRPLGRTTTGIIHHPSSIINHPSSIINHQSGRDCYHRSVRERDRRRLYHCYDSFGFQDYCLVSLPDVGR